MSAFIAAHPRTWVKAGLANAAAKNVTGLHAVAPQAIVTLKIS